jgi:hypothetical protein
VRPPTSYTNKLKVQGIEDYGFADKTLGHFEEDHLIPLAVGGSPRSPKNLWPEKYAGKFAARVKDKLERFLHDRVCDGTVRLSEARRAFWGQEGLLQAFRPVTVERHDPSEALLHVDSTSRPVTFLVDRD